MRKGIDWESRIGRRLRLRDLHVLFAVVQSGSMVKAAAHLGVSQPVVSQAIADLEAAIGVKLLDRGSRGVEPTLYGRTLLKCGQIAFDDLRQGIREIESQADPAAGEVRIGCPESLAGGLLPPVIERLSRQYPRMAFHVAQVNTLSTRLEFPELRERKLDLVLARLVKPFGKFEFEDDLAVEHLMSCLSWQGGRARGPVGARSSWLNWPAHLGSCRPTVGTACCCRKLLQRSAMKCRGSVSRPFPSFSAINCSLPDVLSPRFPARCCTSARSRTR